MIPEGITPGTQAPDFTLPNQHGEQIQLSGMLTTPVLVVFYPYAFSGICRGELADLNARLPAMRAAGTRLVAVSVDTMYALRVFADQLGLDFPLLSDFWPHGEVAQQFGVFDEQRGCAIRGSFLVNTDGVVAWQTVNKLADARDIDAHVVAAAGSASCADGGA